MAYEPTIWKDRVVEKPRTFNIVNNPDGTVTLVPAPGVVVEEGTPVNAANLNKLEQGLKTHEAENAKQHADLGYNIYQLYLQKYYEGKYPYKRGLFFDGFMDGNVIDRANSNIALDTVNKRMGFIPESYLATSSNGAESLYDNTINREVGQLITLNSNTRAQQIKFYINKVGTPTDGLVCKVYSTANGIPIGGALITSPTVLASSWGTGYTYVTFDLGNTLLNAGQYVFSVGRTGSNNSSNYYTVSTGDNNISYDGGGLIEKNSGVWTSDNTKDTNFELIARLSDMSGSYQSQEQVFTQNIDNAVLYVKSKTVTGCSISADIAIYTDTEIFASMTLDSTRDLGDGYHEDKFIFNTETPGNKVKVKIILNRPDTETEYEVSEYGCLLGVF